MRPHILDTMSSKLTTVQCTDSLSSAYKKMRQLQIRHLPVVDDETNIIGIFSDRDFQRAIEVSYNEESPQFKAGKVVADYMSWPVKTVSCNTELIDVVRVLINEKISAVLVTEGGELSGIITSEDLLFVLADLLKKPIPLKDRFIEWVYNSPIGVIASNLAESGI